MEYIKLFQNHSDYENFVSGGTMVKPNVSHCVNENEVHYNPIPYDYSKDYLTFDIVEGGTIVWKAATTATTLATISYKLNDGEWTDITSSTAGTSFNVSDGDTIIFKGINSAYATNGANHNTFMGSSAIFSVKGNIMSLISGDDFINNTSFNGNFAFVGLFKGVSVISAKDLILPVTALTNYCYDAMFSGCTSLTETPELPATTLGNGCYMFMFRDCTSLTTGSVLPATTMTEYCYESMFQGCTSLTTAPELPATTLANNCYRSMFQNCIGLTTAPVLPATSLISYCYHYMFSGCTSLNYIKAMFTTTPSSSYTSNWVGNVAANGTFVKNTAAEWDVTGVNGVPTGWTVETATE